MRNLRESIILSRLRRGPSTPQSPLTHFLLDSAADFLGSEKVEAEINAVRRKATIATQEAQDHALDLYSRGTPFKFKHGGASEFQTDGERRIYTFFTLTSRFPRYMLQEGFDAVLGAFPLDTETKQSLIEAFETDLARQSGSPSVHIPLWIHPEWKLISLVHPPHRVNLPYELEYRLEIQPSERLNHLKWEERDKPQVLAAFYESITFPNIMVALHELSGATYWHTAHPIGSGLYKFSWIPLEALVTVITDSGRWDAVTPTELETMDDDFAIERTDPLPRVFRYNSRILEQQGNARHVDLLTGGSVALADLDNFRLVVYPDRNGRHDIKLVESQAQVGERKVAFLAELRAALHEQLSELKSKPVRVGEVVILSPQSVLLQIFIGRRWSYTEVETEKLLSQLSGDIWPVVEEVYREYVPEEVVEALNKYTVVEYPDGTRRFVYLLGTDVDGQGNTLGYGINTGSAQRLSMFLLPQPRNPQDISQ